MESNGVDTCKMNSNGVEVSVAFGHDYAATTKRTRPYKVILCNKTITLPKNIICQFLLHFCTDVTHHDLSVTEWTKIFFKC